MPGPFRTSSFKHGLAALVCALLCAGCAGRAEGGAQSRPDATVATVEGRAVPARLFEEYLKNGREGLGLDERTEEGRRKAALLREGVVSELIDRELIRRETERRRLTLDEGYVAEAERRAVEQLGGEEKFKTYLAARGLSREEFMDTVHTPLYALLLRRVPGSDLKVPDEELKTFYEAHKSEAEFQSPARTLTFEEAAPDLRRRLLARREAETLKAWLAAARRSAKIRVAEPFRTGALREEFPAL